MTDERHGASAEDAIIEARRAKAGEVRARGENPFANDQHPRLGGRTVDIAQARSLAAAARDTAGRYDEAAVLDGDLDAFIEAYLLAAAGGTLRKGGVAEEADNV